MKGLIVLILITTFPLTGCFDRQERPVGVTPAPASAPAPEQESFDVELFESSSGKLRYRIRAAYMASYETADSSFALLSRRVNTDGPVVAELFDPDQATSASISAAEMRYFDKDHRFEARGNVEVITSTGRRLETEFLIWREDERRVVAPGFVKIKSETEDMQGYGFDADELLENFSLQRVTGRYYLEDD